MMKSKKTLQLTNNFAVMVDAEDVQKIQEHRWSVMVTDQMIPYTMIGDVQMPLANLLTGTPPSVYVQKLDGRQSNNYTKKNLKAGRQ